MAEPVAEILIVEDEQSHAEAIAEGLARAGHRTHCVHSGSEAIEALAEERFDIVITDYRLGGAIDGLEVLAAAKAAQSHAEVIMITAHGSEELVLETIKKGAYDYIKKPLDLEQIRTVVGRAAKQALTARENTQLHVQLDERFGFEGIIGGSPAIIKIIQTIQQVAASDISVLIQGESGTGKELLAKAIHNNSKRKRHPFIPVNCAGLTESILEDELFGHVKGAFTGAASDRKGRFEASDKGTLFLDEVADMPAAMQAKLLRVLEDGEVVRLGANEPFLVDVRLISATNKVLDDEVTNRQFRSDLLYRLKGVLVTIPPLRDRPGDIPLLINHFIQEFAEKSGRQIKAVSDIALQHLRAFEWPGNVRQLRHVIEGMVVLSTGETLGVEDLPSEVVPASSTALVPVGKRDLSPLVGLSIDQVEKMLIENTLASVNGNREQAAKILGMAERTLYRKIREYGLK